MSSVLIDRSVFNKQTYLSVSSSEYEL